MKSTGTSWARAGGYTLLEVLIALGITAVCAVCLGNILMSSANTMDHLAVDTSSDQEMKRALSRISQELLTSSTAQVTLDATNPDWDSVTFQTPGAYAGGAVWGAVDQGGTWRNGWSVRYLVIGGTLFRRVLDGGGNPSGTDEQLCRQIDNLFGILKGFRLVQNGPLFNIGIRVRKSFKDGKNYAKEYTSTVFLKNT